jgi:hypothetical protein
MVKKNKKIKTKNFSVSDVDYLELSEYLHQIRKKYTKNSSNYDFFKNFEDYLYCQKERRDPIKELNRLEKLTSLELTGEFDTCKYEKEFKKNFFDLIELKYQSMKGSNHLKTSILYKNKLKTKNLIESLITPIEKKIKKVLDSNFIITKIEEIITLNPKDDCSHFWHFDPVPMGYGKVFFYFSSSKETDGKTQILSLKDSLKLLESGYNNIPISKRVKDIKKLTNAKDIKIGNRGKYMIFFSGLMLHKGTYPTFGKRKILSINFLRSNYNWKEVFDELWQIDKLSGKWIPTNWPKHY